jgi:hypothetical protein
MVGGVVVIERVLDRLFDVEDLPFGRRWRIAGNYSSPDTKRTGLIRLPWFKECGVYIHRIDRCDDDRHPHNHPYNWGAWMLAGGYKQSVWSLDGMKGDWKRPIEYHDMKREQFHRVEYLPKGRAWSLFFAGKPQWMIHPDTKQRVHYWGFVVDKQFVDWVRYRKEYGRD